MRFESPTGTPTWKCVFIPAAFLSSTGFRISFPSRIEIYVPYKVIKVKWSRYRPGVAHTVGRGIALLFHDRGTRRGWVVSSTPRPQFNPGKDPVPILQLVGWGPRACVDGRKNLAPHWISIPDRPARSQSPYRLSYRAHIYSFYWPFKDETYLCYIRHQSVPRCKHSVSRLYEPNCLCSVRQKSLFVLRTQNGM